MIKFFRHIRQRLLSENPPERVSRAGKFSKPASPAGRYLLYAIGEIILVVIGILIALQINNGNEKRKERAKEINYLKNLKLDLESELKNNEDFAVFRYEKAKAASELIKGDAPNSMEEVQVYTDRYEMVFIWNVFVPNNNTFKELLSSGNLSLIKNEAIKNGLLELDKRYTSIATGEHHMRREHEAYLYDPHVENIAALGFFDLSEPAYGFPKRLTIADVPQSQHQQMIEDAQWQHNNEVFKNGLKLAFMNNGYVAGIHKDILEDVKDLIALIDDEINKG